VRNTEQRCENRGVKTATIREFRSNIAKLIASDESGLVTKHGKPAAMVYPLHDPKKIPLAEHKKRGRR